MSPTDFDDATVERLSDERMRALLTEQGVGVLGLPGEVTPHLRPLSFGYDGDATLYFVYLLFGSESRKETLSERADRARFLVYDAESAHEWESVSVTGRIDPVPDDEWGTLRDAMENAWHPDLFSSASPMRGVRGFRLRIEEWSGIGSSA